MLLSSDMNALLRLLLVILMVTISFVIVFGCGEICGDSCCAVERTRAVSRSIRWLRRLLAAIVPDALLAIMAVARTLLERATLAYAARPLGVSALRI